MAGTTTHADDLRAKLDQYRPEVENVLRRYGASNPRLFGSVARGDASPDSDIDLLVDLDPDRGNPLLRVSGMSEELSLLLGVSVDVVCTELLRDAVRATAHKQAVAL
jgi:uncharacterized protein